LFNRSICSLIEAARLSCLTVTSYIFIGQSSIKSR
jgi:hypothetical protein